MPKITYNDHIYHSKENETVLETLLRNGEDVSFSCIQGVCQTCLLKCSSGVVPEKAQRGLDSGLCRKQYLMPCVCIPETDLNLIAPDPNDFSGMALIHEKTMMSDSICKILLEPALSIYYHAGQYINLRDKNGLARSYSIASVPHQDYYLELHVNRHKHGKMSQWLIDDLQPGDELEITRPAGQNYFQNKQQNKIILLATGTGLAPLWGIARDALHSNFTGEVWLYHGGRIVSDLYYHKELQQLENKFKNFTYRACLSKTATEENTFHGHIDVAALKDHADLHKNCTIHLAGNPQAVTAIENKLLAAGISQTSIFSDPFLTTVISTAAQSKTLDDADQSNCHHNESDYPEPLPEVWAALNNGELLKAILDDFYDAVYEDKRLSPFFKNSTKQRAKEKVYSFYRRVFTGEKVYFGDRPRNAHHWMVITDELLDYRENLLVSFMIKHNLDENIIQLWRKTDEHYRKDIVKEKPQGRWIGDRETAASGFDRILMDVGGVCDQCQGIIEPGTDVVYHRRTGEVSCPNCSGNTSTS